MSKPPQVALLIETSLAYGRGLLRGIARYIHEHGPWLLYFRPQELDASPPPWLSSWRGNGILARIDNRRMARAVLQTQLPTVDVRNALVGLGLPGIGPINRDVARLAFQHFWDSGLRHFAFGTLRRGENRFQDIRGDYFREFVEEAGCCCHIFEPRRKDMTWNQEQAQLARWLKRLPKPIGIMTGDDNQGLQVLDACLRAKIMVPDEVAVVGVNNDEYLCSLSNPPLSSIDVNTELIGYEAAALLDKMMAGDVSPQEGVTEVPPRGIFVRQSSDVIGVSDPQVAAALRLIRENAVERISVGDVVRMLDVSRSTLERRFVALLGRTPKQEILRVQLARAQELLVSSDLPMAVVAARSGFQSAAYFSEVFHSRIGCTPGNYRRNRGVFSK